MPTKLSTLTNSVSTSTVVKIIKEAIGRGAQLKYGPGNNQYARASDFNAAADTVNSNVTNATAGITNLNSTMNTVIGYLNKMNTDNGVATSSAQTANNTAVTMTGNYNVGKITVYPTSATYLAASTVISFDVTVDAALNFSTSSIVLVNLENPVPSANSFLMAVATPKQANVFTVHVRNSGSGAATGTDTNPVKISYIIF